MMYPPEGMGHENVTGPANIVRQPGILHRSLAEALGTFVFVFVGAGAVTAALLAFRFTPSVALLLSALGLGLALFAGIAVVGKVSGGHLNPAVTVGLACLRRFDWVDVPGYIIGQAVGAIVGALLILTAYGAIGARLVGLGAPRLLPGMSIWQGLVVEGLGTLVLVLAYMGTAVDTRAVPGWAPLAIGLTLAAIVLFIGVATGGSVNPARAFGTYAVSAFFGFRLNWAAFIVSYLIGPLIGAIVGAFAYAAVAGLPLPIPTMVGGPRPQAAESPDRGEFPAPPGLPT